MTRSDYTPPVFADGTSATSAPTGTQALNAATLNNLVNAVGNSMAVADATTAGTTTNLAVRGGIFNVRDYGAKGDGSTDDTAALQSAANAAIAAGGRLFIPPPASTSGYYKVTSTVTLQPQGAASQFRLDIDAGGIPGTIRWAGPANGTVFKGVGWKRSTISGLHINTSAAAGVIAWDLDTSTAYGSTALLTFNNCFVDLGAQSGRGWRIGHVSGGGGDLSFLTWVNCSVNGNSGGIPTADSIGWLNEGGNTLNNVWVSGIADYIDKAYSANGASAGNDSAFFYGFGLSHNNLDFEFATPGAYLISGCRGENGNRFLNVTDASNHPAITVQGTNLSAYAPSDGVLVYMGRPGTLVWDGNYVVNGATAYTATAFRLDGFTGLGAFHVRGGGIQASDPFWTLDYAGWQVWVEGVGVLNNSRQTLTRFTTRLGDAPDPNPADPFIPSNATWHINPLALGGTRTLAPTLNSLTLHVFYSGTDGVTIDKLDAYVNTVGAAGAVLRAGVYKLTDQTRPFKSATNPWGALLLDAGTVATDSGTGQKVWTLGTPLAVPANTWFAVGGVDQVATAATRTVGGQAGGIWPTKIGLTTSGTGAYGTGSPGIAFTFTGITGALPSSLAVPALTNADSGVGIHRSA